MRGCVPRSDKNCGLFFGLSKQSVEKTVIYLENFDTEMLQD